MNLLRNVLRIYIYLLKEVLNFSVIRNINRIIFIKDLLEFKVIIWKLNFLFH